MRNMMGRVLEIKTYIHWNYKNNRQKFKNEVHQNLFKKSRNKDKEWQH